ncbi:pilus assembly protein N-terminal domain-containing protein [Bradyrhizobium iriomotense]|uniref:Pilus formation protein N-terminal domain-containing protein n=1 Tax=Bradyrhizobium iriomotense TaxID=441950 RepID=A0ABQ6AW43_9BRAD|nr:pilus assembly protein N-terminal domain-containing protein [Bradyrhizobium iriomotense]GLR85773.1 hypothetical protein GCM10007857_24840 [Bradyrhizobium iriomotense]
MIAQLRAYMLSLVLLLAPVPASQAADQTITLALGTGSVFTPEQPFETVLIDDENVVSIRIQDDRSVIFQALKLGTTNVIFIDAQSIAIANVRIVVRDARA